MFAIDVTRDGATIVCPRVGSTCSGTLRHARLRAMVGGVDAGGSWCAVSTTVVVDVPRVDPVAWLSSAIAAARLGGESIPVETERLVVALFHSEGRSLVRLARLFVDDRDAAEDLVQEAFLRLARHAGRIADEARAPAYLRSIVLNLARDHNRRGLVSLRHHSAAGRDVDVTDDVADVLTRSDDHRRVLAAVRDLPRRQRDCIALRYFEELPIEGIASTLGLSPNSVKTHLRRAMKTLGDELDAPSPEPS